MPRPNVLRRSLTVFMVLAACMRADEFDVVVIGGTPGGVAAAVVAARHGRSVALTEYHRHLGGMAASGLGKSDVETREAIGGLWREFVERVHAYYVKTYGPNHENVRLCRDGYYYEPSVAEKIFDAMVAEQPKIRVYRGHRLDSVERSGRKIAAVRLTDRAAGRRHELRASAFIDATYEGDLAALAGAEFRLGRESRAEFNELHAGVVYQDYETRTFLPGTTGEGDRRLPAYTYRLCLTKDPANSHVLTAPPPGYNRARYLGYIDDWKAGRFAPPKQMRDGVGYYAPTFNTVVRSLSMADIPNGKLDVNMNPRPLGFPFTEENYDYPEASWARREIISERIRTLTLGLIWFLQNDPELPEEHRKLARQFHLARDEFKDNGHFPWQLYVREARRIVGEYTLSENDVILGPALGRTRLHGDSIAAGEFPIDSFPVRKRERGHDVALEGYILMLDKFTNPYQIPYRIMVPKEVDGLLVPVAASTTHVAFSSIRLEPTWMALGQAAATAAHLALKANVPLRRVNIAAVQRELLAQGQVITFFKDIDRKDPAYAALQYFGTKGFFPDYHARASDPLARTTARDWLRLALGSKGETLGTNLQGEGNVSRDDVASLAAAGKWPVEMSAMLSTGSPGAGVTRGSFARMLFALISPAPPSPAIIAEEFINERAPYPSSHASTIVETDKNEMVAAWFGGEYERHPEVGIWVSRLEKSGWMPGVEVASGVQPDGTRHPCWNPVLFQPRNSPLMLFYKVGPSPDSWWGELRTSSDGGRTWSEARRLPDGILGPIKNKPVQLADGTLLAPTSNETAGRPGKWTVHFERSTDGGKTWTATAPLNDGIAIAAIQPSILFHDRIGGAKLQAVGRTRQGKVFTISSEDAGKSWGPMSLLEVANPSSGTDAVTLKDGRHLLIHNPVPRGRTPLSIAVSRDGRDWKPVVTLEEEPGEYSYPAIIQTTDGRVHVTYTWKRERVKHVVLDPARL